MSHTVNLINFLDPSGHTPMELEYLWRTEGFAPTRDIVPRFEGEIWRLMILNLQKKNIKNGTIGEVTEVCDNCQCFAFERMCHIINFCQIWLEPQGEQFIQQQSVNNMEEIEY